MCPRGRPRGQGHPRGQGRPEDSTSNEYTFLIVIISTVTLRITHVSFLQLKFIQLQIFRKAHMLEG